MSSTSEKRTRYELLESPAEPADLAARYPRVWKAMSDTAWAVTEGMLETIQVVGYRRAVLGEQISSLELDELLGDADAHRASYRIGYELQGEAAAAGRGRGVKTSGQIAVLPLYGVMAPRLSLMQSISGGTSVESFMAQFKSALNDPDVSSILIDIDSQIGRAHV